MEAAHQAVAERCRAAKRAARYVLAGKATRDHLDHARRGEARRRRAVAAGSPPPAAAKGRDRHLRASNRNFIYIFHWFNLPDYSLG